MIINQSPETYHAALDAEDAEQWNEAIGKEVALMESHEVFPWVEKFPKGASMIESHCVLGRKLLATGTIDKRKVKLGGHGDLQMPGVYHDIKSPDIRLATIRLALGRAAKHDIAIAVLDLRTAFLVSPLNESLYIGLPDGEWPDPYGQARPIGKLNKAQYGIKQATKENYEVVIDFIGEDLGL